MTNHDKAIRLLEGGVVEIDGNWFRVRKFSKEYDDNPCMVCELDSICRMEHTDVCEECEAISHLRCYLQLASTVNSAGCNTNRTNQGSRYEK